MRYTIEVKCRGEWVKGGMATGRHPAEAMRNHRITTGLGVNHRMRATAVPLDVPMPARMGMMTPLNVNANRPYNKYANI